MDLINGDVFFGTHADLLNEIGIRTQKGERFKQYYKGTYELDDNTYIWIISIDGKQHSGWVNRWSDVDTIIEYNLENDEHPIGLTHKCRIVFDKERTSQGNKFIFRGYFILQSESTNQKRIIKRTSDIFNIK